MRNALVHDYLTIDVELLQTLLSEQVYQFLVDFILRIKNQLNVIDLNKGHAAQMGKLIQKYADLPMDLADASLVILAEELGHGRILSTDQRDFKSYRWKNHKPFQNLLLPE